MSPFSTCHGGQYDTDCSPFLCLNFARGIAFNVNQPVLVDVSNLNNVSFVLQLSHMNIYATEEHRVTAQGPRGFAFTNLVYVMWCSLQFVSLHFLLSVRTLLAYTRTHVSKAIGDMDFENTIIGDLYSESCLSNWSISSYTYFRDSKRRPIPSLVSTVVEKITVFPVSPVQMFPGLLGGLSNHQLLHAAFSLTADIYTYMCTILLWIPGTTISCSV